MAGIFRKYADIMQNLSSKIDLDAMSTCARLIDNCHEVHVIAAGDTGTLAKHMGFCLGRIGIKATYSGLADYYLNTINLADENDVLIAISKSGITKTVIQGAELAKEKGAEGDRHYRIQQLETGRIGRSRPSFQRGFLPL